MAGIEMHFGGVVKAANEQEALELARQLTQLVPGLQVTIKDRAADGSAKKLAYVVVPRVKVEPVLNWVIITANDRNGVLARGFSQADARELECPTRDAALATLRGMAGNGGTGIIQHGTTRYSVFVVGGSGYSVMEAK